jgi:hypothetical protein
VDKYKIQIMALALLGLISLAVAIVMFQLGASASAQERGDLELTSLAGITSPLLQYQGRLADPATGEPVPDGTYTMVLRLYANASGGSPLWTEAKDVTVQDGLFSTVLGDTTPLSQDLFDGRSLWLGVKVGADPEAAPRQQILPVAYALSLLPGAVIDGNLTVKGMINNPNIVTNYEFDDHVYGGMHYGRALAFGTIDENCTIYASSGNISCRWDNLGKFYEITIDGHDYDWHDYVTIVTPVLGGIPGAWSVNGKLQIGIYKDSTSPGLKTPFQFVTFQP